MITIMHSFKVRLILFLTVVICILFYATCSLSAGYINVIVKDEEGADYRTFDFKGYRYTNNYPFDIITKNWSKSLRIRKHQDELFYATELWAEWTDQTWTEHNYSQHNLSEYGSLVPVRDYDEVKGRVLVEVFRGREQIDHRYLDEITDETPFIVEPGLYKIRCSTTIQFDGVEDTIIIKNPNPTHQEGVDERGRFEITAVKRTCQSGAYPDCTDSQYRFTYFKLYTYHVISETLTHVFEGERDTALVCLIRNPDLLGKLAVGDDLMDEDNALASIYPGSTNTGAATEIFTMLDRVLSISPHTSDLGTTKALVSPETANQIYTTVIPSESLNLEVLIQKGIGAAAEWGLKKGICLALHLSTSYRVALDVAFNVGKFVYDIVMHNLKTPLIESIADDFSIEWIENESNYFVTFNNRANAIQNVSFGIHPYLAQHNPTYVQLSDIESGLLNYNMSEVFVVDKFILYGEEMGIERLRAKFDVLAFDDDFIGKNLEYTTLSLRHGIDIDKKPPYIISHFPSGLYEDRTNVIQIAFSEAILQNGPPLADYISIDNGYNADDGHSVSFETEYDPFTQTLRIISPIPFQSGDNIRVTLRSEGFRDLAFNELDGDLDGLEGPDFTFQFITGMADHISSFHAIPNAEGNGNEVLIGPFTLKTQFNAGYQIENVRLFYSIDGCNTWQLLHEETNVENTTNVIVETQNLGLSAFGEHSVWFKVNTLDADGLVSEKIINKLVLIDTKNTFWVYPESLQFEKTGDNDIPSRKFMLINLIDKWEIVTKPEYVRIYSTSDGNEYVTGVQNEFQEILDVIIDTNMDISSGEPKWIAFQDLTTQQLAIVDFEILEYDEEEIEYCDLQILTTPIPTEDKLGVFSPGPYDVGERIYWEIEVTNNGTKPLLDEAKIGFYICDNKNYEYGDNPPSWFLRNNKTIIDGMDVGVSRKISIGTTFIEEDIGKPLYLVVIADWPNDIDEDDALSGNDREKNNYAFYGPFYVNRTLNPDFDVVIDPESVVLNQGKSASFSIYFTGIDEFGDPINIHFRGLPSSIQYAFSKDVFYSGETAYVTFTASEEIDLGNYQLTMVADSIQMSHEFPLSLEVKEGVSPALEITSNGGVSFSTSDGEVSLYGTASDNESGLSSITLNTGAPNEGTLESWRFTVPLKPGDNVLVVTARDQAGNETRKVITVHSNLTALEVNPAEKRLKAEGATVQLVATGFNSAGRSKNVSSEATWTSNDASVASVNAAGLVTAEIPGVGETATIQAQMDGFTDQSVITVDTRPYIGVNHDLLRFGATAGLSNPFPQTLEIWNDGGTFLTWNVSEDCPWLILSRESGSSEGENNIDEVEVSIDIQGLPSDVYTCPIEITASGAAETPKTVEVQLYVFPDNPFLKLLYPKDHTYVATLRPIFIWSGSDIEGEYTLDIFDAAGAAEPVYQTSMAEQSFQIPEGILQPDATYYWRVSGTREGQLQFSGLYVFRTPDISYLDVQGQQVPLYKMTLNPFADALVGTGGTEGSTGMPDQNYGDRAALAVGVDNSISYRSYLNFDFLSNVPQEATIHKADLNLFVTQSYTVGSSFSVRHSAGPWTEGSITWENQPGGVGNDIASMSVLETGLLSPIDLKSSVQDWINPANSFQGVVLLSSNRAFYLASRETGISDPMLPPRLEVSFYYDPSSMPAFESIRVLPSLDQEVQSGESIQFSTEALDAQGVPVIGVGAFQWEVLPFTGDGTITQTGLFTATKSGTCMVVAKAYGFVGISGVITILPGNTSAVVIYPLGTQTTTLANPLQLTAQARDPYDQPIPGATFTWIVTPDEFGSVSQNGLFSASEPGLYQVIAASGGVESSPYQITVLAQILQSITLSFTPETNQLAVGDSLAFSAVGKDGNGNPIEGLSINWSLEGDSKAARIDASGIATGLFPGSFRVKAECGSVSAVSQEISVYCALPAAFELIDPGNGSTPIPVEPTFEWEPSTRAAYYVLEVFELGDLSTPVIRETVGGVSYSVPNYARLKNDTVYQWTVYAVNPCGKTETTGRMEFTTESPLRSAVFWPVADAFVYTGNPNTNYGASSTLDVRETSQEAYFRFDIADLFGTEIVSAELQLYCSNSGTYDDGAYKYIPVHAHEVLGDWSEDSLNSQNAPPVSEISSADGKAFIFQITDLVVSSLVEAWVSGSKANRGVAVINGQNPEPSEPWYAQFYSKENSAQFRPRLVVWYRGKESIEGSAGQIVDFANDTTISEYYPDTNYVADPGAFVGGGTKNGLPNRYRYLMLFDLENIPEDVDNISSYVLLNYHGSTFDSPTMNISAYRISKIWDSTDTWRTFGDVGFDGGTSYGSIGIPSQPMNDFYDTYFLEISSLIQEWVLNGQENRGLMLKATDEDSSMSKFFYSSNHSTNAPYLLVFYDWVEAPKVESLTLQGDDGSVNVFTEIRIQFNRKMDTSSVEEAFQLSGPSGPVEGDFSWSNDLRTVIFKPHSRLEGSALYTIHIESSASSHQGQVMAEPYQSEFTTMSMAGVVVLESNPSSVSFDALPNQLVAGVKDIMICNTWEGQLDFTVENKPKWLSITEPEGSSSITLGDCTTIRLTASSSNFSDGNHSANLVIADNNAANSPLSIPVRLQVLNAKFDVSERQGADPYTFQFYDEATGNIESWSWDFGDGQTSQEQSPLHTYSTDGLYTVVLTVTSVTGLVDKYYHKVNVGRAYVLNIYADWINDTGLIEDGFEVLPLNGHWKVVSSSSSNFFENKAKLLSWMFYEKPMSSVASGITKIESNDIDDEGRRVINFSVSARKNYNVSAASHDYLDIYFENTETNLISLWTITTGQYVQGGQKCIYGFINLADGTTISGYDDCPCNSYTYDELYSDTSDKRYLNPSGLLIRVVSTDPDHMLSARAQGFALIRGDVTYQITSDPTRSTASFTLTDFFNSYNIPEVTSSAHGAFYFDGFQSDGFVSLNWQNPDSINFLMIKVVRKEGQCPSGSDDGTIVYVGTDEAFRDETIINGTPYCYGIYALYDDNVESSGTFMEATPMEGLSPQSVQFFNVDGRSNLVQLSWKNPEYEDFNRVIVLKKTGEVPFGLSDPESELVYEGTDESFVDTEVFNGTEYCYKVYVVDSTLGLSKGIEGCGSLSSPRMVINVLQLADEFSTHNLDFDVQSSPSFQSVPLVPVNQDVLTLLEPIDGQILNVSAQNMVYDFYDEAHQEQHRPISGSNGLLARLEPDRGYEIAVSGDDSVVVSGRKPYRSYISLVSQGTLTGFLSDESISIPQAFSSIDQWEDKIESICGHDGVDWLCYEPIGLQQITELQPGKGYRITLNEGEGTLEWNYQNASAASLTPSREVYASLYVTPDVALSQVEIDWGEQTGWLPFESNRYHTYEHDGIYTVQIRHPGVAVTKTIEVRTTDTNAIHIELPAQVQENQGYLTNAGLIRIDEPLGSNLWVHLSSSASDQVSVQDSVVLLAGQTSVSFDIEVLDNAQAGGSSVVVITGHASDWLTDSGSFLVLDDESILTISVSNSVTEGQGNLSNSGQVEIPGSLDHDLVVTLLSGDDNKIGVPGTATILAGNTAVSFDVLVQDDQEIDGDRTVTVTASAPGWINGTDDILVLDNEKKELQVFMPAQVTEGSGVLSGQGSVAIPGTYHEDVNVVLSSNDQSEIQVPDHVTISSGQTEAIFDVTVVDDNEFDGVVQVSVSAACDGWTSDSKLMDVLDNEVKVLRLTLPTEVSEGDSEAEGSVGIDGVYGTDVTVSLSVGGGDHSSRISLPSSLIISAGQTSSTFSISIVDDNQVNGSGSISVNAESEGWQSDTQAMTVHDNEVDSDHDGLPDDWERNYFGNLDQNGQGDFEADGLSNLDEVKNNTDPTVWDSDSDNIADGWEVFQGFNPKLDVDAIEDSDSDSKSNLSEFQEGTDPNRSDLSRFEWVQLTSMGQVRQLFASCVNEQNIYAIGGHSNTYLKNAEVYDIVSDQWTLITDMDLSRTYGTAQRVGERIYVFGGATDSSHDTEKMEIYDILTNSWSYGADTTLSREGATSAYLGNRIYLIAGESRTTHGIIPAVDVYDPVENSWNYDESIYLDEPRRGHESLIHNQKIYVIGGYTSSGLDGKTLIFDPVTQEWSDGPTLNIPRGDFGCSLVNERIYVFGGYNSSGGTEDSIEVLDEINDRWLTLDAKLTSSRKRFEAVSVNDEVYLIGGVNAQNALLTMLERGTLTGSCPECPIADAGEDASAIKGEIVHLDAANSTPTEGSLRSYLWVQTAGPRVNLSNSSDMQPAFAAPEAQDLEVKLTFMLIVEDDSGRQSSDFCEVTVYRFPKKLSLNLPAFVTEGENVEGEVTAPGLLDQDLLVALESNDAEELSVPAFVTIQQGSSSVVFAITAVNDTKIDGNHTLVLKASADGWEDAEGQIEVQDNESKTISVTLPAQTSEADAGDVLSGQVSIPGSFDTDLVVSITSSDTTEIVCDEQVTVFASETLADFSCQVLDDNEIDGNIEVTVTGQAEGWSAGVATIQVQDDETETLELTVPPAVREGDTGLSGSVSISGVLSHDLYIFLFSGDATEVQVPFQVMIPAGSTSASFDVTVVDDIEIDGEVTVEIRAEENEWGETVASMTVQDNETRDLTLALPASARESDGTLLGQGTLSISGTLDAALLVNLSSGNPDRVQVPNTVVISSGETQVSFDVTVVNDNIIQGNEEVDITATADGWDASTARILIEDDETRSLSLSLPIRASEADGTLAAKGTISIGGTLAQDLIALLSSSDTSEVTVPSSVTVPAGNTSAQFSIVVKDDSEVDGDQLVTITAQTGGWAAATAKITIEDDDFRVLALEIPPSLKEGKDALAIGRVRIPKATQADLIVDLLSSNESILTVPDTVTLTAGKTSVTFNLVLLNDSVDNGTMEVSIMASADGYDGDIAYVKILDDDGKASILIPLLQLLLKEDKN